MLARVTFDNLPVLADSVFRGLHQRSSHSATASTAGAVVAPVPEAAEAWMALPGEVQ